MKKLLGLALMFCMATFAYAQHTVGGTVKNTTNNQKLSNASVHLTTVSGRNSATVTDDEGRFELKVADGNYTLTVSFVGFKTVTKELVISGGDVKDLVVAMEEAATVNGEALVQATRAQESSATTFTNVTKGELVKQNHGQDLPFLLNLTPSAVVNSDAGAGVGYTGIRIRGVDPSRTNVTINGIPVNDAESHGTFWVNTPDLASSVENIQVQRGVGTSTNGAAAFGASINIQTDGLKDKPFVEVANAYGSYHTRKHTLKVGTGLMENGWAFDARLSQIKSDGFVDRASSDLKSFFASGARYGKRSLLKVNVFSGKEVTYQAWNGIPEPRLRGDLAGMTEYATMLGTDLNHLLSSGNRTYNEFTYKNQVDNYQQDHYQAFYSLTPVKYFKLNIGLHYTYGRGYYEEFKSDEKLAKYKLNDLIIGSDTVKRSDIIRRRWLDNDFYGVVFSGIYEKGRTSITIGGGANEYDGRHFGEIIWAEFAGAALPGTRFYEGKSFKKDVNFYTKVNYKWNERFSTFIDIQGRFISYRLNGTDLNGSNYINYHYDLNYQFFNPKAGLVYELSRSTNVYAYAGMANREPERKDIIQAGSAGVPTAEQLINYEAGYRTHQNKWSFQINGFYMDYKNQLVSTGQVNDVGAYNRVNVRKSYRAGIEAVVGVRVTKYLSWQATAAYSRNRISEFKEYVDNWDNGTQDVFVHKDTRIAFSPDWVASSMISLLPLKALQIDIITKYVSKQYLDNTQNENRKLNGFIVNDVRLNYELPFAYGFKSIKLGVLVNNILNEKYEPNGYTFSGITGGKRYDFNYYYPQAGTNILANVVILF